jgi:hypothetical protein
MMMPAPGGSSASLRRCLALALLASAAVILPHRALADDKLHQSTVVWKGADNCARAAVKAYPDYTPEALAKREAHRRLCLRRSNLPGGEDAPAPPVASGGNVSR